MRCCAPSPLEIPQAGCRVLALRVTITRAGKTCSRAKSLRNGTWARQREGVTSSFGGRPLVFAVGDQSVWRQEFFLALLRDLRVACRIRHNTGKRADRGSVRPPAMSGQEILLCAPFI